MNNSDKPHFETPNLTAENLTKLAALFPGVVADGKVNFDLLRSMLGDEVFGDEVYEFTWVGKRAAIAEAGRPIRKTLRPSVEESKDWDTTENLYIEGDNLDVLKLLQESYLGKVKMIYIDPPYNTGNDFVYRDDFSQNREDYDGEAGAYDEEGDRLFRNTEANGRFHSDWCSMMYPRLILARNLLRDDGVIFISIDDNEVAQLRKICDDVFGSSNFVAQLAILVNPRGRHLDKFIAKTHETVMVYVKSYNANSISGVEKEGRMIEEYNREDVRGKYRLLGLRNRNQSFNPHTRPNLYYPLYVNPMTHQVSTSQSSDYGDEVWPDTPDGIKTCWTWSNIKVDSDNCLITAEKTGDEWRIYRKDYLYDEEGKPSETLVKSLWDDNQFSNDAGRGAVKDLFNRAIMDFPKSPALLKRLLQMGTNRDSTILDFFSGSATTAHAVMQLNSEDCGNRKFIMVQLLEVCADGTEAAKAGFKNICEIGKERIRRAGEKIKAEAALTAQNLDIGFRVLKLDDTNMTDVYYAAGDYTQDMLVQMESNIKPGRTDMDLLFGCLLDWGLPLSMPHTHEKIDGFTIHTYNSGDLIACFEERISEKLVREIAGRQPLRAVFRDSGFNSSPDKINVFEIFKLFAPNTKVRVI